MDDKHWVKSYETIIYLNCYLLRCYKVIKMYLVKATNKRLTSICSHLRIQLTLKHCKHIRSQLK